MLTEYNKARVDHALDEAMNNTELRQHLKGFIIDSFLDKYKEELIMMGIMLQRSEGKDKADEALHAQYQDMVAEQIILFIQRRQGHESPILKNVLRTVISDLVGMEGLFDEDEDNDTTGPDPS